MSDKFIEVEHLRQYFPAGGHGKNKKYIQAVDDVSFDIIFSFVLFQKI